MSDSKDLRKEAFEMFQQGFKLCDIAKQLNVPAGTVRRCLIQLHYVAYKLYALTHAVLWLLTA